MASLTDIALKGKIVWRDEENIKLQLIALCSDIQGPVSALRLIEDQMASKFYIEHILYDLLNP